MAHVTKSQINLFRKLIPMNVHFVLVLYITHQTFYLESERIYQHLWLNSPILHRWRTIFKRTVSIHDLFDRQCQSVINFSPSFTQMKCLQPRQRFYSKEWFQVFNRCDVSYDLCLSINQIWLYFILVKIFHLHYAKTAYSSDW